MGIDWMKILEWMLKRNRMRGCGWDLSGSG
jgi:hypothetical protein